MFCDRVESFDAFDPTRVGGVSPEKDSSKSRGSSLPSPSNGGEIISESVEAGGGVLLRLLLRLIAAAVGSSEASLRLGLVAPLDAGRFAVGCLIADTSPLGLASEPDIVVVGDDVLRLVPLDLPADTLTLGGPMMDCVGEEACVDRLATDGVLGVAVL